MCARGLPLNEEEIVAETAGAEVVRHTPLAVRPDGVASRSILGAGTVAWEGVVLGEWALERAWLEDRHPHDEINYVLEGELVVTCGGAVHRLRTGDTIRVPGGSAARYEAPRYARMLFLYAPNPQGLPSAVIGSGRVAAEP